MSRFPAYALLVVGLLQMSGDLLGLPAIKGLGAATAASPAPKVFSAVRDYETYSTRFILEWKDHLGQAHDLVLSPAVYARVLGPYNRRNVYGAALAYGPVLAPTLRDPVMTYALCGEAPLLRELGIEDAESVRVRFEPFLGTNLRGLPTVLEPTCP